MPSIYKIEWSNHSKKELQQTVEYLESEFTEREVTNLFIDLKNTLETISQNPYAFPSHEGSSVRKSVVSKYNTMFYRLKGETIEILTFFSNRQNPDKAKIK